MNGEILNQSLLVITLLLIDVYIFNGLQGTSQKWKLPHKKWFKLSYFLFSVLLISSLFVVIYTTVGFMVRLVLIVVFFVVVLFKISYLPFILIDDLRRLYLYAKKRLKKQETAIPVTKEPHPYGIPRSDFLMKAGLLAGAIPLVALKVSMKNGFYDYHIKRHTLYLPNLPKVFDGIKLGQISDIHSGSFFNKTAVKGGVDMLMREKADLIFFTGDLVNNLTNEMNNYQDLFSKVKAPLGVYSSLGNHDYGNYAYWLSPADKRKNMDDLVATHKNMGWDLLRNENRRLKVDGEEIGILGCENWGTLSRFPKYGNMELTAKNTDDLPVKLLLSHDPSHWRAQILSQYPQIDVMFAGHTHGMQMGVQTENFQWSPIEYIYKEWAGLYTEGAQQLYVNVGYGFLGNLGRVGILPEITIFELKSGVAPLLKKA